MNKEKTKRLKALIEAWNDPNQYISMDTALELSQLVDEQVKENEKAGRVKKSKG